MTADNSANDARVDELETRFALQDQTLQDLGNEVYRQQRQIAELEAAVRQLADRLAAAETDRVSARPDDEAPPHY